MEDASESISGRASSDTICELDGDDLFSEIEKPLHYTRPTKRKCMRLRETIPWLLSGLMLCALILQRWQIESKRCVPVGYWGASELG